MKSVAIVDTKIMTALGDLEETWQGLLLNKCGLKKIDNHSLVPNTFYGSIETIKSDSDSKDRLQQLLDICLDSLLLHEKTSIVLATTKGAVDELSKREGEVDLKFQPWNIDQYIKQKLGQQIPITTMSAACASGTLAVIHAVMKIISGESRFVWVIGIDVLSQFVSVGFEKLKALSSNKCKPFDVNRDGLTLGEGFGAILLASHKAADEYNLKPLANVTGWGAACDATHITAPSRTADGLITAITQSLKVSGADIRAINAHGTGTNYNDAMEIYAFNKIWNKIPHIHSVKGALGHCLGATGVIETAIAVKSIEERLIPPTVGIETPEERIRNSIVVGKARELKYPSILQCNSGFGGINAAVVLQK